jgi:L-lactate dehydrogenase complex protein LldG
MRASLSEVDGEWIFCHVSEIPERIVALLQEIGAQEVLIWGETDPLLTSLRDHLERQGVRSVEPHVPRRISTARLRSLDSMGAVGVGITGAQAGLADTGSLVLTGGGQRSGLVSLLPEIHIALLGEQKIQPSLRAWIQDGGKEILTQSPHTVLVTGPSRTADIEMTLTLGVHGPGRLIVLCYQEP